MNRKILAIVVSSAVALPIAAQVQADEMEVKAHSHPATYEHDHAMEGEDGAMMMAPAHAHEVDEHPHMELHGHSYSLYGSVRGGVIVRDDSDSDATWDIGSFDGGDLDSDDRLFSRIGVRGSYDLGNGMSAGLHIEKRLDNFRTRHQNVSLSGPFGSVTLGQQGSPYYSATSFDGANFTGGSFELVGSRVSGVKYSSNLGGPFNFQAMVMDDNSDENGNGEGVDAFQVGGSLSAGGVNIGVGYQDDDLNTRAGASIGGSFGAIGWELGFETDDPDDGSDDTTNAGFFADYDLGPGAAYFYFADAGGAGDDTSWTVGYSHGLGSGVRVVGEHQDRDSAGTVSILAVVVGF